MSTHPNELFDWSRDHFRGASEARAWDGDTSHHFPAHPGAPKPMRCAAREIIYLEGDPVRSLCQIRSGLVKLVSYLPNGRVRIVRLASAGDLLGLEGLLGQPYHHTAVAICDVELDCAKSSRLHLLEQEDPHQYCQILKHGFGQLASSDRWLADFSTGGIKSRIARLLEFLSRLRFGEVSTRVELLTVNDMADILGVTAESVSRILAEFKRKRILQPIDSASRENYRIDFPRLKQEICK